MSAVMCIQRLTERESQVLTLMGEGRCNKEIAHQLGISERTLDIHRKSLVNKLGARSLTQLGVIAERNGLLRQETKDARGAVC